MFFAFQFKYYGKYMKKIMFYFDNDSQTKKLFASKLWFITKPIAYINFKDTRYMYREQLTLYSLYLYLVSLKC